ncbi:tripartite tricarboxylate transporter TctB family protein [Thermaerobacter litoralis]
MKRDAAAGAGLVLLGLVALAGAPPRAPVAGVMGPGVLPSLVAAGLVLTGLGLVATAAGSWWKARRAGPARGPAQAAEAPAAVEAPRPAGSWGEAPPGAPPPGSGANGPRGDAALSPDEPAGGQTPSAAWQTPPAAGPVSGGAATPVAGGGQGAGAGGGKAVTAVERVSGAALERVPGASRRDAWAGRVRLAVTVAALAAYTTALPVLGFPLASALFMAGMTWYLGERRWWVAALAGGLLALGLWAGFVRGLGVPLPLGVLAGLPGLVGGIGGGP